LCVRSHNQGEWVPQNIALLRQFLAVAKAGSISAGAQDLAMSQPAVTKAIHRLEDELGVSLFERRARGIALTRFGEALLRHAKLIETEWSFAQAEIGAFRAGHAGRLRIGGGPFFGAALLPRAIARLHESFPSCASTCASASTPTCCRGCSTATSTCWSAGCSKPRICPATSCIATSPTCA
jgi:DNA-binding transcriptional LysR family regulator